MRTHVSPRSEYLKQFRAENRERLNAKAREWRKNNPEKAKIDILTRNVKKAIWYRNQKNKPCADCRVKYPHYVMDFDHVRGVKLFNISKDMGRSFVDLKSEMDKCDLVCANCHRERTASRSMSNVDVTLMNIAVAKSLGLA